MQIPGTLHQENSSICSAFWRISYVGQESASLSLLSNSDLSQWTDTSR